MLSLVQNTALSFLTESVATSVDVRIPCAGKIFILLIHKNSLALGARYVSERNVPVAHTRPDFHYHLLCYTTTHPPLASSPSVMKYIIPIK